MIMFAYQVTPQMLALALSTSSCLDTACAFIEKISVCSSGYTESNGYIH